MSEHATVICAGQVPSIESPTAASVRIVRAGRSPEVALAKAERKRRTLIERRLDQGSRWWKAREVVRADGTNTDVDGRYREEVDVIALHGYGRWLATTRAGHPRGGRILFDLPFGGSMDPS